MRATRECGDSFWGLQMECGETQARYKPYASPVQGEVVWGRQSPNRRGVSDEISPLAALGRNDTVVLEE